MLNATIRRGPVIGVIGVGQGITQIREIDKKQERVADDLSRFMTARTPIFEDNVHSMVTEWNRKAAEASGYNVK